MRYLGIDYGDKKTGLAIGDDETGIASPLEVIPGGDKAFPIIKRLVGEEGIDAIVVGLPFPISDHHAEGQLEKTKRFVKKLEEGLDVPVHGVDERFTSTESQRLQQEYGTDVPEDALAAMLILREYLDEQQRS
ncbi:Holliday junction resolvase RuvX [Patescibacteria group bacterium]|nr:Holliday junction resolvase RuvX [Patescibacteria group bacterium]